MTVSATPVRSSQSPPRLVRTKQLIPLYCGPTPLELLRVLCDGLDVAARPPECVSTQGLCSVIQTASRLPECEEIAAIAQKTDDGDDDDDDDGSSSGLSWLELLEPTVKAVHVINSCHLDIGFAGTSQGTP